MRTPKTPPKYTEPTEADRAKWGGNKYPHFLFHIEWDRKMRELHETKTAHDSTALLMAIAEYGLNDDTAPLADLCPDARQYFADEVKPILDAQHADFMRKYNKRKARNKKQ